MYIAKWKKAVWKGYKLCDSKYITFWKKQNYGDSEKISGGEESVRDEKAEYRGFLKQWSALYSILEIYVLAHLSKPMESTEKWALI